MTVRKQSRSALLWGLHRVRNDLDEGKIDLRGSSREDFRDRLTKRIEALEGAGVRASEFWPKSE
jgi:hypothetical protein